MTSRNISYVDLLKIDVEGNELKVFQGAEKSLAEGRIGAIQIEFNECAIDSRIFLRDFWNLLSKDFHLHKFLFQQTCIKKFPPAFNRGD